MIGKMNFNVQNMNSFDLKEYQNAISGNIVSQSDLNAITGLPGFKEYQQIIEGQPTDFSQFGNTPYAQDMQKTAQATQVLQSFENKKNLEVKNSMEIGDQLCKDAREAYYERNGITGDAKRAQELSFTKNRQNLERQMAEKSGAAQKSYGEDIANAMKESDPIKRQELMNNANKKYQDSMIKISTTDYEKGIKDLYSGYDDKVKNTVQQSIDDVKTTVANYTVPDGSAVPQDVKDAYGVLQEQMAKMYTAMVDMMNPEKAAENFSNNIKNLQSMFQKMNAQDNNQETLSIDINKFRF